MDYVTKLLTLENGRIVKKEMATNKYYSFAPYLDGDDDLDEIDCASLATLYKALELEKAGDKAVGAGRNWKYRFYYHVISTRINSKTGKTEFIDNKIEGKVYRRGNKVCFKAI